MKTPWKNLFESADYTKLALPLTPTRVYSTSYDYQRHRDIALKGLPYTVSDSDYTTNTEQKDCKSCGAPRRADTCEYCNRRF